MANWSDPQVSVTPQGGTVGTSAGISVDAGLRAHMLSVYNYMTSGVLLTGIIALAFAWGGRDSLAAQVFLNGGILRWVVMLAPLGIVLWMSFGINRISESTAKLLFFVYSALMGASLSYIFLVYTAGSIALTFFATSAAFASLSLYGYTTQRDLSGITLPEAPIGELDSFDEQVKLMFELGAGRVSGTAADGNLLLAQMRVGVYYY